MPGSEKHSRTPRILLVEDSPADAEMLRLAIAHTGIPLQIVWVQDASQAIEYLGTPEPNASLPCDLVMLDINLPVTTGFELLQEIKAHEILKTLPVIIMSGSNNPEDVQRCYRAGANSFVCKPAQLDEILTLAACLAKYWFLCVKLPVGGCDLTPA